MSIGGTRTSICGWWGAGIAAALLSVTILAGVCTAQAADSGKNVILIGWDGAQRNHVKEQLARNELPTLAALIAEGAMVDIDVVSGATDTKAGWTQLNTGYAPDKTGVYSNGRYQPIPLGYTIEERVEKALGPDNIVTRAMIGKSGHVDNNAPEKVPYDKYQARQKKEKVIEADAPGKSEMITGGVRAVEENGEKFVLIPGKPWYEVSKNFDSWENGLSLNERVGQKALSFLEQDKGKRFLYFVHFAEPDHSGHKSGEDSQEFSDAIKSDDEWTGKIIAKLKEMGIYENTLVYVIVDHGFNEGEKGHSYAPYVFIGTNDKQITRKTGTREDIAPTVLKRFGIELASLQPKLDGFPLDEPAPERVAPATKPGAPAGAAKGGKKGNKAAAKGADGAAAPAGDAAATGGAKAGKARKGGKKAPAAEE